MMIDDGQGNLVPVYLADAGGMVDLMTRAPTREAWVAAALHTRILVDDGEGGTRPGRGVDISEIGPVELSPAVLDPETGEIVAPAPVDHRHHANVRLSGYALTDVDEETGRLRWHLMALAWTYQGALDPAQNAEEIARVLMDVALIDPDTVRSPVRVWL